MKLARTVGCLILLSGMVTGLSHAQIKGLGTIDFPTSGSPQAKELFLRGALLLHSFEYDDAREAFQQAQKMDPDFGMTYWGEAMTQNRPLWVQLDLDDARALRWRLTRTFGQATRSCHCHSQGGWFRCCSREFMNNPG